MTYYLRQAGRGGSRNGVGPIYSSPLFLQRGNGLGSFLGGLFRFVKPILWSGAKDVGRETLRALGRETLRTGGKILTDIAENKSPDVRARDIVSRNVTDSTRKLITKLRGGGGRKRKRSTANTRKKSKKRKVTKRDIFA